MRAPAAAGATLNVMALCIFKPAGNYILPYSYNSIHGTALGLITLTILTVALRRSLNGRDGTVHLFLIAGITTGLATLAKVEMGAAALLAGLTAAVIAGWPDSRRTARLTVVFASTMAGLTAGVYAFVLSRVGWAAVAVDGWLLMYNMPPEIAYFNGQVSGLGDPLKSLGRMTIATAKLAIVAALVASVSYAVAAFKHRREIGEGGTAAAALRPVARPWRLLAAIAALLLVMSVTTGLDRDKGPFLAMPFLLCALLAALGLDLRRERSIHSAILVTFAVYALASLARVILHVRSGGAYASYLLPMSVVLFTYLWVGPFLDRFRDPRVAAVARTMLVTLIIAAGAINAGLLAYRFRSRSTTPISTARGTMVARPDMGLAFDEALDYIDRHTAPGDAIAVLPEGTALTFLSGRRNPLREEIVTPGYLDTAGEERAIRQLRDARTALILVPNRPTIEFGPAVFGRDYCQLLMRWILEHYETCAVFGPVKDPGLEIGDKPFFLRAYCPKAPVQ